MDFLTRMAARRHTLRGKRLDQPRRAIESTYVNVNGHRFHTRFCAGEKARHPVVLVHGLAVSSLYMMPLAEELSEHYRVFAPDLPGFGYTDGPWRGLTIKELADCLADWIEATGLDAPVLFGNSQGCQVIADLAMDYPHLTRGIVLQGPTYDPHQRSAPRQMLRWLQAMPKDPSSQGLILLHDYLRCGARRLLGTFRNALQDPIEDKLPHIDVPALVIRGSEDPIVSERWAREATQLLPFGTLRQLPGGGHTLNYAAPLELARMMRPFLKELYAPGESAELRVR